ncbi:hypothetical protein ACJMK2_044239 [Sinanodonta woodiana]|uniref:BTB domain-containing protein n=1 Tax=Sinanodonta woodiana TaxID=1069815 RepID=A0ABD3W2S3_SINWO
MQTSFSCDICYCIFFSTVNGKDGLHEDKESCLFTSSESEDTVEFPLPGKRYEDIAEFLCCIYPNILKTITDNNVEVMLQLGNEFGVKKLMEKCEDFLVRKLENGNPIPHPEEIINGLCIAERYGLETLRKTSFDRAAKTESELLENVKEFWELPNVITTSVFILRLKLLENCDKKIRSKINEVNIHCSLYHKGERSTDTLCTKCFACIGKSAVSELKQVM